EGGIPIDQPPPALSTPGLQDADLTFSHGTLNKSSSSPELQTLPEAFTKAAAQSSSGGDLLSSKIQMVQVEREAPGESTWPGESVISAGPSSSSASVSISLEFPTAQPGALSPTGHRPRGHTISVGGERKMDRDSYHNRGGPSNAEKSSGLSP
ncbi:hypothetical protein M9458_000851, partial [Cirrhinus mrigala]